MPVLILNHPVQFRELPWGIGKDIVRRCLSVWGRELSYLRSCEVDEELSLNQTVII